MIETGWLIEWGATPLYYCGGDYESSDSSLAIRFARQVDAERTIARMGIGTKGYRVIEHAWGEGKERQVPWVAALNRCRSAHPEERAKPCDECRRAVTFPSAIPEAPDDILGDNYGEDMQVLRRALGLFSGVGDHCLSSMPMARLGTWRKLLGDSDAINAVEDSSDYWASNARLIQREREAWTAHAAIFEVLVAISLLTDLDGEVADYDDVVKAVARLSAPLNGVLSVEGDFALRVGRCVLEGATVRRATIDGEYWTVIDCRGERDACAATVEEAFRQFFCEIDADPNEGEEG